MTHYLQSDSLFMQIAINYAWRFQTLTLPNPAVGALIVYKNTIIALQAHYKAGSPHAEVLACKEAFLYLARHDLDSQQKILKNLQLTSHNDLTCAKNTHVNVAWNKMESLDSCCVDMDLSVEDSRLNQTNCNTLYTPTLDLLLQYLQSIQDSHEIHHFIEQYHSGIFNECVFFVTLEPCNHYGKTPPCAKLLQTIHPQRIVIGHRDTTLHAKGGIERLAEIPITQDILHSQIQALLFPFMQWQKYQKFTLFKVANRLNGDYKNGNISNEDSKIFTHNMRCIADNIVISGETLRNDNPLLDTRFAIPPYADTNLNTKLPTLYILSKTLTMKDLYHYNIYGRDIKIIDSIEHLPTVGFNIIEGGFNLLQLILQESRGMAQIDCIMGYIAPSLIVSSSDSINDLQHKIAQDTTYPNILKAFSLYHTDCLNNFWQQQHGATFIDKKQQENIVYWLFKTIENHI